jgi:hypothetical protein
MQVNFDNHLFRCSSLGHIMTVLKTPESLPKGCITHLNDIFNTVVHEYREDFSNKYLEKGILCEEDSLGLLGKFANKLLMKNKEHFKNDFVSGTPDCVVGSTVIDTKTSWDVRTFNNAEFTDLYYWQLIGYMWLTEASKAILAYCLVDTPQHLIEDEQRRALWQAQIIDEESEAGQAITQQIERNLTVGHIPEKNRLKVFTIERNEADIDLLKVRIELCRKELNKMYSDYVNYQPIIEL